MTSVIEGGCLCGAVRYAIETGAHTGLDPAVMPDHHYGIESRLPWTYCGPTLPGREKTECFEGQPP